MQAAMSAAGILQAGATGIDLAVGVGYGIANGDWSRLQNAGTMLAGNFYLDENKSFLGGAWQGFSRYTWELPQTTLGSVIADGRNIFGDVDRVELLGGAKFVIKENSSRNHGWSLGNSLNVWVKKTIEGDFVNWLGSELSDDDKLKKNLNPRQVAMHEYGHFISSQKQGLAYLFSVGIVSALVPGTLTEGDVYDIMFNTKYGYYPERWANRNAKRYFGNNYGIEWREYNFPASKTW